MHATRISNELDLSSKCHGLEGGKKYLILRHQDAAKSQGSAFAQFIGQRRAPGSNTM